MPHAITHFLIPAVLTALFRDFYLKKKDKRRFPLHYVLIAGLAGLLPDLDIAVYYILYFFGATINQSHRTFTHNLLIPIILFLSGIMFFLEKTKNKELGKHKLKLSTLFFVISFGILTHLILDALVAGSIMPFYPFTNFSMGINLIGAVPGPFQSTIIPVIDAVILIFWMIYMELKHKISDFI